MMTAHRVFTKRERDLNLVAALFAALFGFTTTFAAPTIVSVSARQTSPWNGKVDVEVQLSGTADELAACEIGFSATNGSTKEELSTAHLEKAGDDVPTAVGLTRRYVWDAVADVGAVKIDELGLTAYLVGGSDLGGVQLWKNGPIWAECNVGAAKPEEYGYYFWWGDTLGYKPTGGTLTGGNYYSGVTWVSSEGTRVNSSPFTSSACPTYGKSDAYLRALGYIDSTGRLTADHDAATAHLGAPWRMPTSAELEALVGNCAVSWTAHSGVYGYLVRGHGEYSSKTIFLPAAGDGIDFRLYDTGDDGDYWSSTPQSENLSYGLYFAQSVFVHGYGARFDGHTVRPVREPAVAGVSTSFSYDGQMPERTQTTEVKVETRWLKTYFPSLGSNFADYEKKANETAANGQKVWEAYLIGLDPRDPTASFISLIAINDGKPVVTWQPDLGDARVYTILGSTDLKAWTKVEEGRERDYGFFKVAVEMKDLGADNL